jgi:hypothetical protein
MFPQPPPARALEVLETIAAFLIVMMKGQPPEEKPQ